MMHRWRPVWMAVLVAAVAMTLAACGSSKKSSTTAGSTGAASTTVSGSAASTVATTTAAAGSLKDPGKRTITVIPSTAASEFLAVSIKQMKDVGAALGWTVNVCDGAGDATKIERCVETAVTQKVDAIVTQALGGPEFQKGAAQAKAAGIPILAAVVTPTPGFEKLFDGVFADDNAQLGAIVAKWIKANRPNIPIVGEEITANAGGQGYINGIKQQLKAEGLKFTDLRDTDFANITNSMSVNAKAIINKNKGPLTFVDFSDFGPSVYWKEIDRAGRNKEITMIARYDDPTTVKLMRSGANIVVHVTKAYQHVFDLYQALLDKFLDNKPLPPTSQTVYEPGATVKGIKDFPAGSNEAFPFAPALKAQLAKWGKLYKLSS